MQRKGGSEIPKILQTTYVHAPQRGGARARSSTYIRGGGGKRERGLFWQLFFPFSGPSISECRMFQLARDVAIFPLVHGSVAGHAPLP